MATNDGLTDSAARFADNAHTMWPSAVFGWVLLGVVGVLVAAALVRWLIREPSAQRGAEKEDTDFFAELGRDQLERDRMIGTAFGHSDTTGLPGQYRPLASVTPGLAIAPTTEELKKHRLAERELARKREAKRFGKAI